MAITIINDNETTNLSNLCNISIKGHIWHTKLANHLVGPCYMTTTFLLVSTLKVQNAFNI